MLLQDAHDFFVESRGGRACALSLEGSEGDGEGEQGEGAKKQSLDDPRHGEAPIR
jgi:hypothetical protein